MSVSLDQLKVVVYIIYLSIYFLSFVLFGDVGKLIYEIRKCNYFFSSQIPELLYKSLAAKLVVGMPFKVYMLSILLLCSIRRSYEIVISWDINLTSFVPLI